MHNQRLAALVIPSLFAAIVAACSDGPVSPAAGGLDDSTWVGSYTLQSIDGQVLPFLAAWLDEHFGNTSPRR
jgi:hypothetical protein